MAENKEDMARLLYLAVLLLAPAFGWPQTNNATDLILYWTFDDIKSNVVMDVSGHGHHGMVKGKIQEVEGVKGKAIRFSGADGDCFGTVYCADTPALNPPQITITFWLKPVRWCGKGNPVINKGWDMGWGIDPHYWRTTILFCANIGKGRTDTAGDIDLPLNQWRYNAVTFDGKTVVIYADKTTTIRNDVPGILNSLHEILRVGGASPAVACIDELKIYRRALNPAEIMADQILP